jgi:hypothetical protein
MITMDEKSVCNRKNKKNKLCPIIMLATLSKIYTTTRQKC